MSDERLELVADRLAGIADVLEKGESVRRRQNVLLERIVVALEAGNERRGEVVDALVALGVTMEGRR